MAKKSISLRVESSVYEEYRSLCNRAGLKVSENTEDLLRQGIVTLRMLEDSPAEGCESKQEGVI